MLDDITQRCYPKDPQEALPSAYCLGCGGELYKGDTRYDWDGDGEPELCVECFKEKINELLKIYPEKLADMMDVQYAEVG